MTNKESDDSLQLIENDITECILEKTITENNLFNINNNLSKLSKNIKKIEMNEINFPNVNINFENFEIIKKKPVLDDNKRGTNKINVKNTKIDLKEINDKFAQSKIDEKKIQNNNDEPKINSNESKINSNEPKITSNESKINSNEIKINSNEQKNTPDETKINSNEQKTNSDNSKKKDLNNHNKQKKSKNSYSSFIEEEENENNHKSESNIELNNIEFSYEILQEKPNKSDLFFKIILVGDFGVGKTSLINNSFKEFNIVNGIKEFYIKIKEQIIKIQIYDTCEQEKNNSLNSSFYNNSSLAILVYSIDNKKSFKNINKWLNEIKSNNNKDIKIFLIGNKIDLNNRKVTKENGENFKKDNNLDLFLETSTIENNNNNNENIFIEAIKQLFNKNKNNNENINPNEIIIEPSNNNQIKNENNETEESCCEGCYKFCKNLCILF